VLQALSAEELDVALGHEGAHLACHDNLKRLLFLLTPEIVPFTRGFAALERAWRKFSEWAADDEATQCDANRSLVLASALVRLARMGSPAPTPALAASLLAADENLARRVERLLHAQPAPNPPRPFTHNLLRGATLMMAGSLAVGLLLTDVSLVVVHGLLEQLIR
jgi:beta-lactamase regulating signal transducer with metallopeptidase domain